MHEIVNSSVDVASVDDFVATCNTNAIAIVVEPRVYPWGTKEVVIRDPDGFILVFREVAQSYGT